MVRTDFTENPESFEIDAEFFEMNPQTTRETFEQYLWDNYNSDGKVYLKKPVITHNATPIRTNTI